MNFLVLTNSHHLLFILLKSSLTGRTESLRYNSPFLRWSRSTSLIFRYGAPRPPGEGGGVTHPANKATTTIASIALISNSSRKTQNTISKPNAGLSSYLYQTLNQTTYSTPEHQIFRDESSIKQLSYTLLESLHKRESSIVFYCVQITYYTNTRKTQFKKLSISRYHKVVTLINSTSNST